MDDATYQSGKGNGVGVRDQEETGHGAEPRYPLAQPGQGWARGHSYGEVRNGAVERHDASVIRMLTGDDDLLHASSAAVIADERTPPSQAASAAGEPLIVVDREIDETGMQRFDRRAFDGIQRARRRLSLAGDRNRRVLPGPELALSGIDGATVPGTRTFGSGQSAARRRSLSPRGWRRLQLVVDAVALMGAVIVALSTLAATQLSHGEYRLTWLFALAALAAMGLRRMYGPRHGRMIVDMLISVTVAMSLATMAWITATVLAGLSADSAAIGARLWVCSTLAVCLARTMLLVSHRRALRRGRLGIRTLVVGAGEVGSRVVLKLDEHPEYGMVPVGMLEMQPGSACGDQVPVVGTPEDMLETAQRMDAEHVILAFSNVPDRMLLTQVRRCQDAGIDVSLVPRLFESFNQRIETTRLGTLPILSLQRADPRGPEFQVKYMLDRAIAAFALLVLFVPLVVIALAVKLTSRGPVLFRQRRVSCGGRVFHLLKFRSMRTFTEGEETFVPQDGMAPGGIEGVDRRTRLGRFLRRSFLDELPQLLNVVRGDMSLVGPRPERPEYVELYEPLVDRYSDRHRARSGITGWAQVHGLRGQTSVAERVAFDNQYIDNWSLGLDLKIMLLTVMAVSTNKND